MKTSQDIRADNPLPTNRRPRFGFVGAGISRRWIRRQRPFPVAVGELNRSAEYFDAR
jgi:hypothetical protein